MIDCLASKIREPGTDKVYGPGQENLPSSAVLKLGSSAAVACPAMACAVIMRVRCSGLLGVPARLRVFLLPVQLHASLQQARVTGLTGREHENSWCSHQRPEKHANPMHVGLLLLLQSGETGRASGALAATNTRPNPSEFNGT